MRINTPISAGFSKNEGNSRKEMEFCPDTFGNIRTSSKRTTEAATAI